MGLLKLFEFLLKIPAAPYLLLYRYIHQKNKKPNESEEINIAIREIENYRFGFFGELGYGLSVWWPYLNYISAEFNIKLKTIGLPGSKVFVKEFSKDHIEIEIPQGDMWGDKTNLTDFNIQDQAVLPSQKGKITIEGKEWVTNSMHVFYDDRYYKILNFSNSALVSSFKDFIVINIKNHYNWGNTSIQNFYLKEDIVQICETYKDCKIYLNAPKFWKEPYTIYFDSNFNDLIKKYDNLVSLDEEYSKCKNYNEVNLMQISILQNASIVFATQGGNAVLSILCNPNVKILMRGGEDYPDYVSLARIKKSKIKIGYEVKDLIDKN